MKLTNLFSLLLGTLTITAAVTMALQSARAAIPSAYTARIPADPQQTCAQQASQLATHLAQGLRAQVTAEPSCVEVVIKDSQQTYKLRSIVIPYEQDPKPPYVQIYKAYYSNDKYSMELSGSNGIYTSYAACLNELESRKQEYSHWTGLETITAGCYPETSGVNSSGKTKFALRVDGFGQPQRRLQLLQISNLHGPAAAQALATQTASILSALGAAAVARVEDGLLYYAATNYYSMYAELGFMANSKQCEAQKAILDQLYANEKIAATAATCEDVTLLGKQFTNLQIVGVGRKVATTRGYNSDPYYSFEECMAVANLKNKNPDRATASFCVQTVRAVQENYANESYTLTDLTLL